VVKGHSSKMCYNRTVMESKCVVKFQNISVMIDLIILWQQLGILVSKVVVKENCNSHSHSSMKEETRH
jgi:hypothetical protein